MPLSKQHRGAGSSHRKTTSPTRYGLSVIPDGLEDSAGIETMHMINKGRVRWLIKADVVGQVKFIHKLFGVAV
jgi:hypothetical protein